MGPRLGLGLRLEPLVRLLLRRFLGDSVALLQAAHKLFLAAGYEGQVVVGKFAPLLLDRAMHLLPLAFHLFPIHDIAPPGWHCTRWSRVRRFTIFGDAAKLSI